MVDAKKNFFQNILRKVKFIYVENMHNLHIINIIAKIGIDFYHLGILCLISDDKHRISIIIVGNEK